MIRSKEKIERGAVAPQRCGNCDPTAGEGSRARRSIREFFAACKRRLGTKALLRHGKNWAFPRIVLHGCWESASARCIIGNKAPACPAARHRCCCGWLPVIPRLCWKRPEIYGRKGLILCHTIHKHGFVVHSVELIGGVAVNGDLGGAGWQFGNHDADGRGNDGVAAIRLLGIKRAARQNNRFRRRGLPLQWRHPANPEFRRQLADKPPGILRRCTVGNIPHRRNNRARRRLAG